MKKYSKYSFIPFILALASCTNTAPISKQPPVSQAHKFRSHALGDRLIPKHQPILGDTREQLDFKTRDAQAILDGTPRPQSPTTLAVLAGNPPSDVDVCNLPFAAITKSMFENCAEQGMSYIQVANTFGMPGELTAQTENSKTYTWNNGDGGAIAVTFVDDKLTSKTQSGLK